MILSRVVQSIAARLAALLLILLPVVLSGCNVKSGGFVISKPAHVRFFNALVDGGPMNVTIGDNTLITGLPFEGLTTYNDVDSGNQEVRISVAGGASTIVDTTTLLTDDSSYTYLVFGTSASPLAQLLTDATVSSSRPSDGQFGMRITNAAAGSAGFDIYVTQPNMPLDNASPNIANIAFGTTTGFGIFTPGTLQVRLTLPNSKVVIYDGGTFNFTEHSLFWFIGYTKGSSTLLNGALLMIDDAGSGAIANSNIAQFKLVHAAPGTAPIDALVNGSVALANVPYQSASGYQTVPAGTRTVTIETTTAPGATIASAQPAFSPATDTSIIVTGAPGAQQAVVISDLNLPGTTGSARIRFGNMATDAGPVDVYVNFARQATALANNAASGYVEVIEDTYTVNFDVAGTTNVVLSVPQVALTAGRTYTVYLVGSSGQYAGIVTRDD